MLKKYLKDNFIENTPIILSDLNIPGMSQNNLRLQIKKLCDAGILNRYDSGIYFIPKKSIFKSGSTLSINQVIEAKYLTAGNEVCGYYSGLSFANKLGVTTQVPNIYEVVTNKATNDCREVNIASSKIILRKPKAKINNTNYLYLQLLDFIKESDRIAEVSDIELKSIIKKYMDDAGISFSQIEQYIPLYPDRLFRNLYNIGLIYGTAA